MADTAHVERPTRLAGGKTYCACGQPWPCTLADPVSVWQGELQMSGVTLHVHVLDDGTRIIEAADLHALLQAWEQGVTLTEDEAAAFARWQRGEDG